MKDLGIIGWEGIELTVISAILADLPILFIGGSGAAKTVAAKLIAQSLLGDKLKWAVYECPHIQMDDIVGLPDMKSLQGGTMVRFIGTPISVWNINAVVLDEITRAPETTANKLLELVRTKSVFGMPTPLQLVFSTGNPPTREYATKRLDRAMTSRFVVIPVPEYSDLTEDQAGDVLDELPPVSVTWPDKIVEHRQDTKGVTLKIRALLAKHKIHINARSAKHIRALLDQSISAGSLCERSPRTLTTLVLSCVPETTGLCVTTCDDIASVTTALMAFFESHLHMAMPSVNDWPAYVSAVVSLSRTVTTAEDAESLKQALKAMIPKMIGREKDAQRVFEVCVPVLLQYLPFSKVGTIESLIQEIVS